MKCAPLLAALVVFVVAGCDALAPPAADPAVATTPGAAATSSTVVVTANDLAADLGDVVANPEKWFFYDDETDEIDNALGSFVSGPSTPPLGAGSAQVSVAGTQRRNLATYQFAGTPLADITALRFATYNPSAGNGGAPDRSAYLTFNVDFDGSDGWQQRLAYVPRRNGTVVPDTWQEWDAVDGGAARWNWSGFYSSGNQWPDGDPTVYRTWADLLASFPGIAIRTSDPWLGLRVGEPYASGYAEALDAFVFGTAAGATTWDFEPLIGPPTSKDDCKQGGWQAFNNPSFRNQGQCIRFVNTGR